MYQCDVRSIFYLRFYQILGVNGNKEIMYDRQVYVEPVNIAIGHYPVILYFYTFSKLLNCWGGGGAAFFFFFL